MSLPLPRTLLWRTFLLIAVLMLLSVAAWALIFSLYEREPRARQLAQTLASVANLTRASLLAARPDARLGLLRELSDREGIHIYPAEPGEQVDPLTANPLLQAVHVHLIDQLGPRTRLSLRRNGEDGLFVTFHLDDDGTSDDAEFWVALPRERLERILPMGVLGWAVAVLGLSLIGAWLIVFVIVRPLKSLQRAAKKVGAGESPPLLTEDGPEEIAATAQAFNRMSADLARLDQDRALILAGISHDLRTPLTRLRMATEMAADASMRDGMIADIEDMDQTISQFLDFARSRPDDDARTEAAEDIDVAALCAELAESYQRRGHPVTLVPPVTLPSTLLHGRRQALRRVVANLVENALRYAPGTAPRLAWRREGPACVIEVADQGPGIPAADRERVRRPFTRLDTARGNALGAGLGLAIVERIVASHGGQLALLPNQPQGLIARVTLPAP